MFEQYSVSELALLLDRKQISAIELAEDYLSRIQKDKESNAFLTVTAEKALADAKEVDRKRMAKETVSRIAGIPVAVKDNFCTEGVTTTCGSKILADFVPQYDSTVAARLKKARTILLGKTNMDEFGMGSTGENSAFGPASFYHPADGRRYLPGGSSSGSAAAVKEQLAPIAIGSDTGGSVRQPAALCGLFGYKPTYGGISRSGLVSFAPSMDTPGVLGRSCKDMAYLCSYLFGSDDADATSIQISASSLLLDAEMEYPSLYAALPEQYLYAKGVSPKVRKAVLQTAEKLQKAGWKVELVSMPMTEATLPAYYVIACAEAASNLARFDGIRYGHRSEKYADISELIARSRSEGFGDEVKRRIIMGNYVLSAEYYDAYYRKAQQVKNSVIAEFSEIFKRYHLILTPAAPDCAAALSERKLSPTEMYATDLCTVPASLAGLPAMTVPIKTEDDALPIGLQIIGKRGSDHKLFGMGNTVYQLGR